jgi:thiol-disulfide isomerase/thioredoxin
MRQMNARGIASAVLILLAAGSAAAQMPADALFRDFQLTGDFIFELDGKDLESAEVYNSERAAAYLILAPELSSPVLINPRAGSAESVHLMKVAKRPDGSIDLLADATFNRLSELQIHGTEVVFDVKGTPAKLKPKPPLLGFKKSDDLKSYKPEYARLSQAYHPDEAEIEALRAVDQARVLVYFGSWCPTCGRLVPRVIRVDEELKGSKIEFQYYGLAHDFGNDTMAKADDIHGVPTGIVYIDGREIGRLEAADLNTPETSIARLLNGR